MENVHITGLEVAYYYICHTKLWLFSHNINFEQESDLVQIGKLIHETSYKGHKEIQFGDIAIDIVKSREKVEIHEIKKSRKMNKSHQMQLLYYLYYLKNRGVNAIGVIDYPKEKKREYLELTPENENEIERALTEIEKIIKGNMPRMKRKSICKKCAYYEFCFGGENEE